ncbi:hypothetical protein FD754_006976, partial [Muntiacus muntjak]
MAAGAPQQSGQMAEETPGFLEALLRDFPAPLSPEGPLPWKVPGPALSLEEAEGELAELALGFLNSRSAPPSLAACLAHEAVSQLLQSDLSEFRKLPEQEEEDGDGAEEKAPVTLLDAAGLARSLFDRLWQACSQWQQQVPAAAQAPQRQWLVSTHAIRNARRRMEDRHVCLPAFNLLFGLERDARGCHKHLPLGSGQPGSSAPLGRGGPGPAQPPEPPGASPLAHAPTPPAQAPSSPRHSPPATRPCRGVLPKPRPRPPPPA